MQRKVQAGGIAGAATVLLVFLVETLASLEIPAEVASSATTLLSVAVAYLIPEDG